MVLQVSPTVLVSAYADEFDSAVVLEFGPEVIKPFELAPGLRLLTVNMYALTDRRLPLYPDLYHGVASMRRYNNVHPMIADFMSDDWELSERLKARIREEVGRGGWGGGWGYISARRTPRSGNPRLSRMPREWERKDDLERPMA
jgi:hypothetical protein